VFRTISLASLPDTGVEYAYYYCLADLLEFPTLLTMMTQSSANPAIDLNERPFAVHFSKCDSADRAELERFMRDAFRRAYGAEIKRFKPCLMSLRGHDDKLIAACGLHSAMAGSLFLECYLDQPIEALLSSHTGYPLKRSDIVEIGDFSVAESGMARYLITAINDQLHFTSKQWAVFTAAPALRDEYIKLGMNPEILADADINRLPPEDRTAWGNYFEQKQQVMVIRRMERRNKPRITVPNISAA
jgi:hypothetical protein